ncbi:MAG TPA: nitroreductase/quinone reductase family protein [Mycobacteriales bacterium]|nr:nitroreductase/quinone reductase family protein [Mycobacteriales bacterium]
MITVTAKDILYRYGTRVHTTLFTATGGRLFHRGRGMPMVKLTTVGRRTGQPRTIMATTPLQMGESFVLIASFGGDDREPQWCQNIRTNGEVEATVNASTRKMHARVATPEERAELWPRVVANPHAAFYDDYQKKTDREIPIVIFDPA